MIVAILGVRSLTGDSAPSRQGEQVADATLAPQGHAEDVAAQALLQSAAVAMESWLATNGSFAGTAAGVAGFEPNITWVVGGTPVANQVVTVGADQASYTLSTPSTSGTTITYSRDAQAQVVRSCGPGCSW